MICLKNLAKNYQLAIFTSIHQPNSDLLMMFENSFKDHNFIILENKPENIEYIKYDEVKVRHQKHRLAVAKLVE